MVRYFDHRFASNTLMQILFDAILLFLSVVLAVAFLHRGELRDAPGRRAGRIVVRTDDGRLNTIVGLYRRNPGRTSAQTTARIVAFAAAGGTCRLGDLHVPAAHRGMERNVAAGRADRIRDLCRDPRNCGAQRNRHRCSPAGRWCSEPAPRRWRSSSRSGSWVRRSGSWASTRRKRAKRRIRWSAQRILTGGIDLVDAVRRYKVDEIIVAVRERRGGVLPLRELLDCKLMGVRVLDLSSYYERAVGQLRLDSLARELADLRRRIPAGVHALFRQAAVRRGCVFAAPAAGGAGDGGDRRGALRWRAGSRSSTGRSASGRAVASST